VIGAGRLVRFSLDEGAYTDWNILATSCAV
jgi:hypothetical protein